MKFIEVLKQDTYGHWNGKSEGIVRWKQMTNYFEL